MSLERNSGRSLAVLAGLTLISLAVWPLLRGGAPPRHGAARHVDRGRPVSHFVLPLLAVALLAGLGAIVYDLVEDRAARQWAIEVTGGNPARGPAIMVASGCAGCHTIPGVAGARGLVGPPLAGIAERVYIAGVLENTPGNLIQWIRHAREVDPQTAMPSTGLPEDDARDVAAYLYALR